MRVRPCWIVRTGPFFIAVQSVLLVLLLFRAAGASPAGPGELAVAPERWGWLLAVMAFQVCLYLNRVDQALLGPRWGDLLSRSAKSFFEAALIGGTLFIFHPVHFARSDQAVAAALAPILMLLAIVPALRWGVRHRRMGEGLLILGAGPTARRFYRELVGGKPISAGGAMAASLVTSKPAQGQSKIILDSSELSQWARQRGFTRIVVAEPLSRRDNELVSALIDCKLGGLRVEQAVDSYERLRSKLWLAGLHPDFLIYSAGFQPSRFYLGLKRIMDAVGALLLLFLSAPLLGLVAIAIKLESPGPVLFRQERVGRHGRTFILFKFRSMRQDAESASGPVWSPGQDDRVTAVGRLLRKFRLDELPQLLNVLRGEMSLIGPRPERPYFVTRLKQKIPYYQLRHSVRPGISGWAQVMYRYGASLRDAYEKLQYDLYYIRNMSLGLDLRILLKTVKVVLFGRGR